MKKLLFLIAIIAILFLVNHVPGHNPIENIPNKEAYLADFWMGLLHGIIAPLTFLISLFSDNVNFYEVHNNGRWYNFGFLAGAGIFCRVTLKLSYDVKHN